MHLARQHLDAVLSSSPSAGLLMHLARQHLDAVLSSSPSAGLLMHLGRQHLDPVLPSCPLCWETTALVFISLNNLSGRSPWSKSKQSLRVLILHNMRMLSMTVYNASTIRMMASMWKSLGEIGT